MIHFRLKKLLFTFAHCALAALLAGPSLSWTLTPDQLEKLRSDLDRSLNSSGLSKNHFGLSVTYPSADGQEKVWAVNEEKKMIPASLTKIVTAAAVLDEMGPGKKLETHLLSAAPIQGHRLMGDLVLRGGGDPGFVSESMWFLVNEFLRTGVTEIQGDLVVDDSLFDSIRFDPSREPGRVDRAYDAPIGAMSFNWNAVNIYVRPGPENREPARVFLDPQNSYLQLVNNTRTQGRGRNINVEREVMSSLGGKTQSLGRGATAAAKASTGAHRQGVFDRFTVSGHIAPNVNEVTIYRNISRPDLWSGYNLLSFLQQRGIEVKGAVRSGPTPSQARSLAKVESKPVSHMVSDLMKFSNNFVAEMLTKSLAAHTMTENPPNGRRLAGNNQQIQGASLDQGMGQLRQFVVRSGIPAQNFNLVNPSGLSRQNQFRPVDLVHLLNHLRKQPHYFPELLSSFPIAGVDGTLQSRMNQASAPQGRLRAKTGLLNGVVGLAGYAPAAEGELLTFAFIYNGPARHTHRAREILDQLATHLAQNE